MKKFTLFLSALLFSAMSFAADVDLVFNTEDGLTALGIELPATDGGNGALMTELDDTKEYGSDIIMTVTHAGTKTRIWKKASGALDLRTYKDGGSLTLTAPEGNVITQVVFDGGKIFLTVDGVEVADKTWTGNAAAVTFAATATCNINKITVTYAEAATDHVAPPTITGAAEFKYYTDVKITANEDLTIYYTTDGTEPAKNPDNEYENQYWGSFTIEETTTVKAIAYDENGNASAVVEKTFKEMETVTCEEAAALCETATTDKYIIRGYITEIKYSYSENYGTATFWMADTKDGENVLQAYSVAPLTDNDKEFAVGDYVEVIGSLKLYNTTAEVDHGTYTVANLVWAGDEREGYLIQGLDPEYGELAIDIAYEQWSQAWFLSMAINGELVAENVTLEDEPTFDEEENLILQTTIVTEDETEYELDLTVAKDAAVVINVTDATMAMSDSEWEVGTMYVSGTWNGYNVKVQLNGWTYYGYGEYEDASIQIVDENDEAFMWANAPVTIEKKEDGTAVVTSEFCYYTETLKFYELNVTVAQAVEHEVEKVTIECNVVFDIEEVYEEWEDVTYQYPYLSGTCDLGEIRVDLWHEQVGRAIDSLYGEWGWTEVEMWGMTMLMCGVGVEITPEAQGEEEVYPITLDLLQGTVATYTKGEPNTFQGVFLGSDWKEYTLKLTEVAKPAAVDNITTTVAPVKMIQNGQLVIIRNGVKYNVQGAVIK